MADVMLLQEIGRRVAKRRKELGLTQEQVAEQMDTSIQMVSNLELGKKAVRPENLVKLCRILQTSSDYILTGVPSEKELDSFSKRFSNLKPDHQKVISDLINCLLDRD